MAKQLAGFTHRAGVGHRPGMGYRAVLGWREALKFVCDYAGCNERFRYGQELARHKKAHIKADDVALQPPIIRSCPVAPNEPKHNYACNNPGCLQVFASETHLKAHTKIHRKLYECTFPECGMSFHQKRELTAHAKTHAESYVCDWHNCGRSFQHRIELNAHIKTHQEKYACEVSGCLMRFSSERELIQHQKAHIHRYACTFPDCGWVCHYEYELTAHQQAMHPTPRRKAQSGRPGPKAMRKRSLGSRTRARPKLGRRQARQKEQQWQYACDFPECVARFRSLGALSRHYMVHSGKKAFVCDFPLCEYEGNRLEALIRHQKRHLNNMPYVCESCGWHFRVAEALLAHTETLHSRGSAGTAQDKRQPRQISQGLDLLSEASTPQTPVSTRFSFNAPITPHHAPLEMGAPDSPASTKAVLVSTTPQPHQASSAYPGSSGTAVPATPQSHKASAARLGALAMLGTPEAAVAAHLRSMPTPSTSAPHRSPSGQSGTPWTPIPASPSFQSRNKWSQHNDDLLFAAWKDGEMYNFIYKAIFQAIRSGTIRMDHIDYSQQNIRDRIINKKKTLLLNNGVLFPGADIVKLDKTKTAYMKKMKKNPERLEGDIDDTGKPTRTALDELASL